MKVRPVGRVTPCAPSVATHACGGQRTARPTTSDVARLQRRRRDIFVESARPKISSPVGAIYSVRSMMPLLRSCNHFESPFYKYAAPTVLPMNVPQGQPKIARRFNGGSASTSPRLNPIAHENDHNLTPEEIALVEGAA